MSRNAAAASVDEMAMRVSTLALPHRVEALKYSVKQSSLQDDLNDVASDDHSFLI